MPSPEGQYTDSTGDQQAPAKPQRPGRPYTSLVRPVVDVGSANDGRRVMDTRVFPANHQRYLFSRFRHIDEILGDAVQALERSDETRLFPHAIRDATPAQRKILEDYLAQLRFALKRFMDKQALEDTARSVSGLWTVRTAIIFAQTAVTELRPGFMAGYGALGQEAVQATERLVAELGTLLKRMGDYLDKGEQGDLAARLAHLDATSDEITLLRELERIITAHGLVELRATLESLTERITASRYEVAVFGRVNSGKSSLLNWWLGDTLLPTGVTPVTAVPTRIVHGQSLRARVKTASSPSREMAVDALADYVTERGNPGNVKRVLEIVLEVPSVRLREGVSLVDTPGLGSLASAGAAQTLEYLPRCDLGIQLLEAGGVIAREDLSVVRALLDGGSDVLIVLSKADRLCPADLNASVAYATELFSRELGLAASVHPISTLAPHTALAEAWFDQQLLPRLASYHDEATRLLRRKVGALRETVIAVLASRLAPGQSPALTDTSTSAVTRHEDLTQLRAQLERTRSDFLARTMHIKDCAEWLIDGASEVLVAAWTGSRDDLEGLPQRVQESIARRAVELADVVCEGLKEIAEKLRRDLAQLFPSEPAELAQMRGRPAYDTDALPLLADYQRPRWAFARPLLQSCSKRRIDSLMLPTLTERLSVYGDALRHWGGQYLDALGGRVDEVSALAEAKDRSRAGAEASPQVLNDLHRDLALLQRWPGSHPENLALDQVKSPNS